MDYDGRIYRVLELYGGTTEPNEGVRWSPDKQFEEIRRIEREHPLLKGKDIVGVADPAIWDSSRGESIAEHGREQRNRLYSRRQQPHSGLDADALSFPIRRARNTDDIYF